MTLSIRHITLLIGILTVIFSFFWFGRATNTYDIIIVVGLAIAIISFLVILFKKDTPRNKVLWTFIVFVSIGVQRMTESLLVKLSYKHFITQHEKNLNTMTQLIKSKNDDLFLSSSSELWTSNGFTQNEANQIKNELKGTGISVIQKDSSKIFFRTWGMLDVSRGIYYFYSGDKPGERYKKIFGNWYY